MLGWVPGIVQGTLGRALGRVRAWLGRRGTNSPPDLLTRTNLTNSATQALPHALGVYTREPPQRDDSFYLPTGLHPESVESGAESGAERGAESVESAAESGAESGAESVESAAEARGLQVVRGERRERRERRPGGARGGGGSCTLQ